MLETEAGDDPIAPKLRISGVGGGSAQVSARATETANCEIAKSIAAMPIARAAADGVFDNAFDLADLRAA
jgi:hypothetical protein